MHTEFDFMVTQDEQQPTPQLVNELDPRYPWPEKLVSYDRLEQIRARAINYQEQNHNTYPLDIETIHAMIQEIMFYRFSRRDKPYYAQPPFLNTIAGLGKTFVLLASILLTMFLIGCTIKLMWNILFS